MKYKISQKQFDKLRMIYAVLLLVDQHSLHAKELFNGDIENPEYWNMGDALMRFGGTTKTLLNRIPEDYGYLKFRETQRGCIVYIELCRLRKI